jgi:hypothetical protein
MSGRVLISFVDFAALSFDSDCVHCGFDQIVSGAKLVRSVTILRPKP